MDTQENNIILTRMKIEYVIILQSMRPLTQNLSYMNFSKYVTRLCG